MRSRSSCSGPARSSATSCTWTIAWTRSWPRRVARPRSVRCSTSAGTGRPLSSTSPVPWHGCPPGALGASPRFRPSGPPRNRAISTRTSRRSGRSSAGSRERFWRTDCGRHSPTIGGIATGTGSARTGRRHVPRREGLDMSTTIARDYERFRDLSYDAFRELAAADGLSRNERIGFPDSYRDGYEAVIYRDVCRKLTKVEAPAQTVFDIGPGCSDLPLLLAEACGQHGHTL